MNETQFFNWLCIKFSGRTPNSRFSNCHRVEKFEGNLDDHYTEDKGGRLLEKLSYSTDDKRNNRPAKHAIPIDGDIYNGTATLKQAVKLYFQFKSGVKPTKSKPATKSKVKTDWPNWNHPTDDDLYEIVKLSAKYIKFLNPEIIIKVVNDNIKNQKKWSNYLTDKNVTSEIYLWEKSPCAFPGVRRYAGSKEIAYFRKHTDLSPSQIKGAVRLDDNDFPKHIWSFIFRGKPFQKYGPKNYALAHLADHKEHNNRLISEYMVDSEGIQHPLFGLFTCPTNTAFIPSSLLRPTDFSPLIRRLLILKTQELYGDFCNILPPWVNFKKTINDKWHPNKFEWAKPVGTIANIGLFLEYRSTILDRILTE